MLHPAPTDALLSRLYLAAVLPSVAELARLDPAARAAAGKRPWAARLQSPASEASVRCFIGALILTLTRHSREGGNPYVFPSTYVLDPR